MTNEQSFHLRWVKIGSYSGIIGVLAYALVIFLSPPDFLAYILAFSFGPLLSVSAVGLYHFISVIKKTPSLQIAVASTVAGGITVLIMLTIQLSIGEIVTDIVRNAGEGESQNLLKKFRTGLNSVHWGLDVAWDILIGTATILFGLNMLKHPKLGVIIGVTGMILGSLLLIINLYHFPHPPSSVGSFDVGPLTAVWFLIVFILMIMNTEWFREIYQGVN